jgi:PAS domain S-box-containing protein
VTLLNAIEQAVIATDTDGNIVYWNPAAEALYGWSAAEVHGRNVVEVTPARISREEAANIMRTIAAGEIWSGVFPVQDRHGRAFDAAVTDLPIVERGNVVGVIGVSKEDEHASALPLLLAEFANAIDRLWPGQLELIMGPGLEGASATVGDPHLLQLLAVLAMRQLEALDRGERLRLEAARPAKAVVDRFGLAIPAARCAYLRLARQSAGSNLSEAMQRTVGSQYAAMLVARAGGRLFMDAMPAAGTATHLFLPIGI